MNKPTPLASGNGTETGQASGLVLTLPDQPGAQGSHRPRRPRFLPLGGRAVAVLAGNLIALSLLLSACQDSTTEVVMTPTPGTSSSLPSSSQPSSSAGADGAVTSNTPTPDQNQPNWRLTDWVENNQPLTLVSGAEIFLAWEQDRISGSGGCNRFGAAYRLEGDRVIVGPIQSTRRACDQPIMEQESRFFAALQRVGQATLANNQQLTLTYGEGPTAGSLRFSPRY